MRANEIIMKALGEVGISEYPPASNNVKYNTWYYNKEVSGAAYPWCAAFISWLFKEDRDMCPRTASCAEMLAWFEKRGQVVKSPQAGDIVFFKYSTNSRRTNHVGLVVGVQGNNISTIEGNTSISSDDNGGAVMKRMRNNHIVAYARPMYDDAWCTVAKGDKNAFVTKLQHLLNQKFGAKLDEDGDAGDLTEMAIISAQGQLGLTKDGVAGLATWSKLL